MSFARDFFKYCAIALLVAVAIAYVLPFTSPVRAQEATCSQEKDKEGNFLALNKPCGGSGTCKEKGGTLTCEVNDATAAEKEALKNDGQTTGKTTSPPAATLQPNEGGTQPATTPTTPQTQTGVSSLTPQEPVPYLQGTLTSQGVSPSVLDQINALTNPGGSLTNLPGGADLNPSAQTFDQMWNTRVLEPTQGTSLETPQSAQQPSWLSNYSQSTFAPAADTAPAPNFWDGVAQDMQKLSDQVVAAAQSWLDENPILTANTLETEPTLDQQEEIPLPRPRPTVPIDGASLTVGKNLEQAAQIICTANGCDPVLTAKALAGVANQESGLQGIGCNQFGYCGVGQLNKSETASSLKTLQTLANDPSLSDDQKSTLQDVIASVQSQIKNGVNPNLDDRNGAFLLGARQLSMPEMGISPLAIANANAPDDPVQAARIMQLAQLAPSSLMPGPDGQLDFDRPLTDSQIKALTKNLVDVSKGDTINDALDAMGASPIYSNRLANGAAWENQFLGTPGTTLFANNGAPPDVQLSTAPANGPEVVPNGGENSAEDIPLPRPRPAEAPGGEGGAPKLVIGDSIAQGMGQTGGYNTVAVSGYNTKQVLGEIQSTDVTGADVAISGGCSNNLCTAKNITAQLDAARDGGANSVTYYGVAPVHESLNPLIQSTVADYAAAHPDFNVQYQSLQDAGVPAFNGEHPTSAGYSAMANSFGAYAPTTQLASAPANLMAPVESNFSNLQILNPYASANPFSGTPEPVLSSSNAAPLPFEWNPEILQTQADEQAALELRYQQAADDAAAYQAAQASDQATLELRRQLADSQTAAYQQSLLDAQQVKNLPLPEPLGIDGEKSIAEAITSETITAPREPPNSSLDTRSLELAAPTNENTDTVVPAGQDAQKIFDEIFPQPPTEVPALTDAQIEDSIPTPDKTNQPTGEEITKQVLDSFGTAPNGETASNLKDDMALLQQRIDESGCANSGYCPLAELYKQQLSVKQTEYATLTGTEQPPQTSAPTKLLDGTDVSTLSPSEIKSRMDQITRAYPDLLSATEKNPGVYSGAILSDYQKLAAQTQINTITLANNASANVEVTTVPSADNAPGENVQLSSTPEATGPAPAPAEETDNGPAVDFSTEGLPSWVTNFNHDLLVQANPFPDVATDLQSPYGALVELQPGATWWDTASYPITQSSAPVTDTSGVSLTDLLQSPFTTGELTGGGELNSNTVFNPNPVYTPEQLAALNVSPGFTPKADDLQAVTPIPYLDVTEKMFPGTAVNGADLPESLNQKTLTETGPDQQGLTDEQKQQIADAQAQKAQMQKQLDSLKGLKNSDALIRQAQAGIDAMNSTRKPTPQESDTMKVGAAAVRQLLTMAKAAGDDSSVATLTSLNSQLNTLSSKAAQFESLANNNSGGAMGAYFTDAGKKLVTALQSGVTSIQSSGPGLLNAISGANLSGQINSIRQDLTSGIAQLSSQISNLSVPTTIPGNTYVYNIPQMSGGEPTPYLNNEPGPLIAANPTVSTPLEPVVVAQIETPPTVPTTPAEIPTTQPQEETIPLPPERPAEAPPRDTTPVPTAPAEVPTTQPPEETIPLPRPRPTEAPPPETAPTVPTVPPTTPPPTTQPTTPPTAPPTTAPPTTAPPTTAPPTTAPPTTAPVPAGGTPPTAQTKSGGGGLSGLGGLFGALANLFQSQQSQTPQTSTQPVDNGYGIGTDGAPCGAPFSTPSSMICPAGAVQAVTASNGCTMGYVCSQSPPSPTPATTPTPASTPTTPPPAPPITTTPSSRQPLNPVVATIQSIVSPTAAPTPAALIVRSAISPGTSLQALFSNIASFLSAFSGTPAPTTGTVVSSDLGATTPPQNALNLSTVLSNIANFLASLKPL